MNSKLLEILAAQTSCGGRSGIAELMARLRPGSGDGAPLDPRELLERIGNGNPALKSLLQQMTGQQDAAAGAQVIDVEAVEKRTELLEAAQPTRDEIALKKLEEMQGRAEEMAAELKLLRDRNDQLAAAMGACCLCWGQDLGCRSCRGRGGPGFCIPDKELFEEYVLPAVHTFRAQNAKVRSITPATQSKGAETESQLRSAASY